MGDFLAALSDDLMSALSDPAVEHLSSPGTLARYATAGRDVNPPHLRLLDQHLCRVEAGEIDRLMVFMPPRHGKSSRVSWYTPPWFLVRNPDKRVMLCSYEADFAASWGRKARDVIERHPEFGVKVRQDSKAAHRWELSKHGGGMSTAGVGGPITGKGADLLIIDDYCKNADEANSLSWRDRAWDWWRSTAQTRLEPGGGVVLVACMTGDTPVLRPDGTTTPLRDIRPGDEIATYSEGAVTSAKVLNWANQGPDALFSVRMRSGRMVRANARHPFLIVDENGVESWRRTDSLKPGNRIRLVTGANGGASPAPNVTSQPNAQVVTAKGCARPTTTSSGGTAEYVRRLSTHGRAERHIYAIVTVSTWQSTTGSSRSRAASALSAPTRLAVAGQNLTMRHSASTTTMTPVVSEGSCATVVTLPLGTSEHRKSYSRPLSTYSVSCDEVVEIIATGSEDVFDIEVERTHTFIANGLATHNTRWHEDDLAGRLLADEPHRWTVINLPALAAADDPLGRAPGAALWPDRYDEEVLADIRASIGPYFWSALYQQSPAPVEGALFKRASFRYWRPTEGAYRLLAPAAGGDVESVVPTSRCRRFMTVDVAASTKTSADYTVAAVWAVTPGDRREAKLLLLDRVRLRLEGPDQVPMILKLKATHNPSWIGVEKAAYGLTLLQELRRAGVPVRELKPDSDKVSRALVAVARCENGQAYFPADAPWLDEWERELLAFPVAPHDDQVDVFAYAANELEVGVVRGFGPAGGPPPHLTSVPDVRAWEHLQGLSRPRKRRRRFDDQWGGF